jgi:serine/threonine protein kinase
MITDSLLGKRLDEYEIEALLGKGGMARVYRGVDIYLQRRVAIKVIDTPFRADPSYTLRFEREAQAIAQLEHPYIVRLYRYGERDGMFYMAMQYVEGADLQTVLKSYRADGEFLDFKDVLRLTRQICSALDYTHQCGVIHRDIKPSNVLLNKQGDAILTDFGLALSLEVGTRGEVLGSPTHVAPEQAVSSANAVPQSDLYSVGVILYEMLTGRLPFQSDDALAMAMMHVKDPPPPPRLFRPALSPETEAVLYKALAKNPAERYASGAELVADLEVALQALPMPSISSTLAHCSLAERAASLTEPLPLPFTLPTIPPAVIDPKTMRMDSRPLVIPHHSDKTDELPLYPSGPIPLSGGSSLRALLGRIPWVGWLGLVIVVFLCLALSAASLSSLLRGRSTPTIDPPAAIATRPAVATSPSPVQTATATRPVSPTPIFADLPTIQTPTKVVYTLVIATHTDESLLVFNQSNIPIPLDTLQIGDGRQAIQGSDWKLSTLNPGECIVALKDKGKPKLPDLQCQQVAKLETASFWRGPFNIYYNGQKLLTCSNENGNQDEEAGDKVCILMLSQ